MNCRFLIFLIILGIAQMGHEPFIIRAISLPSSFGIPMSKGETVTGKHVWKSNVSLQSSEEGAALTASGAVSCYVLGAALVGSSALLRAPPHLVSCSAVLLSPSFWNLSLDPR